MDDEAICRSYMMYRERARDISRFQGLQHRKSMVASFRFPKPPDLDDWRRFSYQTDALVRLNLSIIKEESQR